MHLSAPIFILIGSLVVIVLLGMIRRPGTRSGESDQGDPSTASFRDDDRYWLAGFIYNNPDDPDLFVPKRYGGGMTLNFGRPLGKALLIGSLLLPLALIILQVLRRS